jgi:hypothetical protein
MIRLTRKSARLIGLVLGFPSGLLCLSWIGYGFVQNGTISTNMYVGIVLSVIFGFLVTLIVYGLKRKN